MNVEIELIKPDNLIAGCISIYKNSWKDTEKTISDLNEHSDSESSINKFIAAKTLNKVENIRTNYHMGLNLAAGENDNIKYIVDDYFKLLYATSVGYNRYFDIDEPVFFNEGFNALKYQTGQEYGAHYDGGSATGRTIASILYLNDDYEGGEIEFVNFGVKIKPEKGMFLLFPATFAYRHIAHPVVSGTKYAIVTWLHDRPIDQITPDLNP